MQILPYDYFNDRPSNGPSLVGAAPLIAALRAAAPNTLLLDNGDLLQGTPMGDYIAGSKTALREGPHPMIAAMNEAGYDAATLGNHDFNYGLHVLTKALAEASFPVVLANVARRRGAAPPDDETLLPPYALLERDMIDAAGALHPIRIGILGLTPPQILDWDKTHLDGKLWVRDVVETAAALVPKIRAAGADVVVALAHTGLGAAERCPNQENAGIPLAAVTGLDALVLGHTHQVFPGPIANDAPYIDAQAGTLHGTPTVMPGFWGSHIGVIDLWLARNSNTWTVTRAKSRACTVAGTDAPTEDVSRLASRITARVARAHSDTLRHIRRPLGQSAVPIYSVFALLTEAPALRIIHDAQRWYVSDRLACTVYADLPLLSAASPFKAGGGIGPSNYTDIPAGVLAVKHVADLYPYPNLLRAVQVSGAQVRNWLEWSARLYNQIPAGAADAPLIGPAFPAYDFDMIDGLTYQIDVARPARFHSDGTVAGEHAGRILDLRHDGRAVLDEMSFIVVTNSYRTGGGGSFPGCARWGAALETDAANSDVIARYVESKSEIHPVAKPHWRLAPLHGTTVLFKSAPSARAYLAEVSHLVLEDLGDCPDGFARFRLHL